MKKRFLISLLPCLLSVIVQISSALAQTEGQKQQLLELEKRLETIEPGDTCDLFRQIAKLGSREAMQFIKKRVEHGNQSYSFCAKQTLNPEFSDSLKMVWRSLPDEIFYREPTANPRDLAPEELKKVIDRFLHNARWDTSTILEFLPSARGDKQLLLGSVLIGDRKPEFRERGAELFQSVLEARSATTVQKRFVLGSILSCFMIDGRSERTVRTDHLVKLVPVLIQIAHGQTKESPMAAGVLSEMREKEPARSNFALYNQLDQVLNEYAAQRKDDDLK